jgi:hypothetical protein
VIYVLTGGFEDMKTMILYEIKYEDGHKGGNGRLVRLTENTNIRLMCVRYA